MEDAVSAIDETVQQLPGIDAALRAALVEPAFDPRGVLGWREPDEGQEVSALEVGASFLESILPLEVDQRRGRVGKGRVRIGLGSDPLRLDEDRPAGTQSAQRIVEPSSDADQFGRGGAVEIGAAETGGTLK